jgi:hypothetical protein
MVRASTQPGHNLSLLPQFVAPATTYCGLSTAIFLVRDYPLTSSHLAVIESYLNVAANESSDLEAHTVAACAYIYIRVRLSSLTPLCTASHKFANHYASMWHGARLKPSP